MTATRRSPLCFARRRVSANKAAAHAITVLAATLVGDGLRDTVDPTLKGR